MVKKRISSENILLLVILAVALLLRLYKYHDFSLSNDELSALFRVQYDSFRELVDQGFYVDGHPGGIQVLLFYWVKIFGDSPASVRLPFVFMGVGAVYFIYRTGKSWFGVTAGLLAAALLATLEFPVLYSRIARPYGSGLFVILFLTWVWSELISTKNKPQAWRLAVVYGFANALCMYNHYFSFLMAFIIGVSGLFFITVVR
jgi:4-amino-4-deoxy-L-arabinose transferase-like glycosyltransferase